MKKYHVLLTIFCFCCVNVKSQNENVVLGALFKGQKQYITDSIQQKQQSKYLALLHFANVIHSKILNEIQRIDASFPGSQSINFVEGFNSYNSLSGVIWQGDSVYFSYTYGLDKKLVVLQRTLSQLNDTCRVIVQNFSNWDTVTFASSGHALGAPTDRPFFLASKIQITSADPFVQSIGFYYQ